MYLQALQEAIAKEGVEAILGQASIRDVIVGYVFQQQCFALCQKSTPVLHAIQPEQLATFNFDQLIDEWAFSAPLFLRFLTTAANINRKAVKNFAGVCTAGAALLRQRNMHMSALQHIVGLILFHGNATKLVSKDAIFQHEMYSYTII